MKYIFPFRQLFLLNSISKSSAKHFQKNIFPIFCLPLWTQQLPLFILKPCITLKSHYEAYQLPGTTTYILPIENITSTLYILETQTIYFFSFSPSQLDSVIYFFRLDICYYFFPHFEMILAPST